MAACRGLSTGNNRRLSRQLIRRRISSEVAGNDRIIKMLRRWSLISICGLIALLGGCQKRQGTQNALVYVPAPAPPPAAATTATKPQVLVLEEPPPPPEPEPEEETPPPQNPEPTARHKPKRAAHPEATEPDETPTVENPETPETPPAEVPALEPRQSSAQENELHRQYVDLEQDIRTRLAKLSGAHLSGNDQKTLEDARTFFAQSKRAMMSGDLPRAMNLAHKAGLLLAALE